MQSEIFNLIHDIPILIAGIDPQKRFIIFNAQCEQLLGYSMAEMKTDEFAIDRLLPPSSGFQQSLQEIMLQKPKTPFVIHDLPLQTKNGKLVYVNWSLRNRKHPLIEEDITWFVGYDVTDEALMRMNLQASEKRFQTICRATNDAVWDWDLKTNYLWWNDGMRDIFGYEQEQREHSIDWWINNIHPDDRVRVKKRIFECVGRGDHYWFDEYRFRRSDGSYAFVFDRGFIIQDETKNSVQMIGGMMDVTDKKIFQENLSLKTTQLREYAYFNSHKFRGPLSRLISLAHLLEIEAEANESNRMVVKQIQVAAEELDRLVKELATLIQ